MKDVFGWKFPDNDELLSKRVKQFPHTGYQQETIDEAFPHVKKFNLAIDIGANVGLHSVRFGQKFQKVVSFEPSTSNFECLLENTKPFNNIEINKLGLGSKSEKVTLSIPTDNTNCGAFSIIDFKDHRGSLITEEIDIITLDSLQLEPDLIKVDTQSFELEVLKGSVTTLLKYKPVLILEVEYKKPVSIITEFLKKYDYDFFKSVKKDKIFLPR